MGQRQFNRLLLLAGRRGGKTRAAAIAAVEAATIPNSIIWVCAPTFPKLVRYVIPALQELIPESWVQSYSAEFYDLRLTNGTLIHGQSLEDKNQGRGQGIDLVWLDECCELTLDHWEVIRPSLTERRGAAILSSSPRSFDWVYREFYQRAEEGVPGYWACRYKTSENPIISPDEIADAKATMSATMFSQEYEADFVTFTGAVYGDLIQPQILRGDAAVKTILPEWPEVATWRQVLVGLDTGADHPFGATKIVATERGLVVVGEYLERHRSFIQHAAEIKRLAGPSPHIKYAINRNERQPMIELAQHGIFCQAADNDVVAGTERVKSWLHARQLWFVESACPKTIQQMMSYRWADDKAKDGQVRKEKVFKLNDELPDCLRYSAVSWPVLPTAPPVEAPKPRSLDSYPPEIAASISRLRRLEERDQQTQKVASEFWM